MVLPHMRIAVDQCNADDKKGAARWRRLQRGLRRLTASVVELEDIEAAQRHVLDLFRVEIDVAENDPARPVAGDFALDDD